MPRSPDQELRKKIIALLSEGSFPSKIASLLKKNTSVILRNIKAMEEEGLVRKTSRYPALFILTNKGKQQKALFDVNPISPYSVKIKHNLTNSANANPTQIHTAHKIKLIIPYEGKQPEKGAYAFRYFGKHRSQRQTLFKISRKLTILAFTKKLIVWVHRPKGITTIEQMRNAQAEAYEQAVLFASTHNIKILSPPDKPVQSHHVVENKVVNETLKPLFEKHGEAIKERIGSGICKTSHKGKIEHEGIRRLDGVIVQGSDVATGLEYLTVKFPNDFGKLTEANMEFRKNLELHLEVLRKIGEETERRAELDAKMLAVLERMEKSLDKIQKK